MAIDRIGKGGNVPQTPEGPGKSDASKGAERFTLEKPQDAQKAGGVDPTRAASPLARLRAGEIDVNGYVDLKVEAATQKLHGLNKAELDTIKKALREQIASDPALVDLVRTATGKVPSPPEE